ncbi:MAG: hypothetical protein NC428_07600 [Clostridium sp.]|nr:hypothetical protein [Clostridium sp.]
MSMEKADMYYSNEGYDPNVYDPDAQIVKETKELINRMMQPIFYGSNAQIRKEMPEKFMEEVDRYDRENNFPMNYDEMER